MQLQLGTYFNKSQAIGYYLYGECFNIYVHMLCFFGAGSSSHSGSVSTVVGVDNCTGKDATQPQSVASPRRSLSLSPADALASGWKRPWMSQV